MIDIKLILKVFISFFEYLEEISAYFAERLYQSLETITVNTVHYIRYYKMFKIKN